MTLPCYLNPLEVNVRIYPYVWSDALGSPISGGFPWILRQNDCGNRFYVCFYIGTQCFRGRLLLNKFHCARSKIKQILILMSHLQKEEHASPRDSVYWCYDCDPAVPLCGGAMRQALAHKISALRTHHTPDLRQCGEPYYNVQSMAEEHKFCTII